MCQWTGLVDGVDVGVVGSEHGFACRAKPSREDARVSRSAQDYERVFSNTRCGPRVIKERTLTREDRDHVSRDLICRARSLSDPTGKGQPFGKGAASRAADVVRRSAEGAEWNARVDADDASVEAEFAAFCRAVPEIGLVLILLFVRQVRPVALHLALQFRETPIQGPILHARAPAHQASHISPLLSLSLYKGKSAQTDAQKTLVSFWVASSSSNQEKET